MGVRRPRARPEISALKRHWKVEPAWLATKRKVGVWSVVVLPLAGPPLIPVFGGTVSTVKERALTASWLPATSIALTEKLRVPSARGVFGVRGEPHPTNGPLSKRHWTYEAGSVQVNAKVGVESLIKLPWAGPDVIVTTGGVVSAVKLLKAL